MVRNAAVQRQGQYQEIREWLCACRGCCGAGPTRQSVSHSSHLLHLLFCLRQFPQLRASRAIPKFFLYARTCKPGCRRCFIMRYMNSLVMLHAVPVLYKPLLLGGRGLGRHESRPRQASEDRSIFLGAQSAIMPASGRQRSVCDSPDSAMSISHSKIGIVRFRNKDRHGT